ncbi:long-chain fatty acid--CoA ligase [Alkalilimnicola ehrlichii]|uniref:Long-chain fatty acid--CoA ligase n=1 Tax=Alkalilimnicola ehrlichii TaxID=351052 RepID=A0A3E0WTF1_9GAMM|nr:AMP-binding protein [Alkalilimnicola ehrlichii]RFA29207.1 long-chain fatty acid--CoA ligase [Alkalilimnicola ehrlichii]RFA36118.1 long-chain fatty acid--CoA ligase [Alkalilimnicola ehrlichii]
MTAALIFENLHRSADEVRQRGLRLAGGLTQLGVEEGDVIALMLRNDPVYLDVIMACRTAGIYYCPINWHFKTEEARYLLQDSGAKVLIIQSDLLASIAPAVPDNLTVLVTDAPAATPRSYEHWLQTQPLYDGPERAPRGHMAYTSGTTGRPKGVRRLPLTPEQLPLLQQLSAEAWGVEPGVRTLMPAPLYHSAPSSMTQQTLQLGDLLVLMPRFEPEQLLALIERHRITTVYLVPIMYVRLLRLPAAVRQRYDLSSVRFVASTGAPCAPEVKRAMLDWWGDVIYETYASSETGMLTVQDPQGARRKPGSVGLPITGAQIKILREDGRECEANEIGIIYGRQPAFSDFTYHNNPEARAKAAHGELATVGDMGYRDEAGYLYVCDRAADMVISGGVNIYPAEIENALLELPEVADCAILGVPDEEYGESLLGLVQPADGLQLEPATLRTYLSQRLANYKVPRDIRLVTALPRDDNGKVAKRKLRDRFWNKH